MTGLRRRGPLIAAVVAAIVVAVVLVLLLAGGDDDEPTVSRPSVTAPPTQPQQTVQPTETTGGRPSNEDAAAIQRTVTELVGANERGDAAGVCRIVGRQATGSGFDALHTCANGAGVDVSVLPISDELSIDRIRVVRGGATASLASGVVISLRRVGGAWQVTRATR